MKKMIDKALLKLLGKGQKYIFGAVGSMMLGLLANLTFTASLCQAVQLLIQHAAPDRYILPGVIAVAAAIVRYFTGRLTGNIKDKLGRTVKKDLREKTYDKIRNEYGGTYPDSCGGHRTA